MLATIESPRGSNYAQLNAAIFKARYKLCTNEREHRATVLLPRPELLMQNEHVYPCNGDSSTVSVWPVHCVCVVRVNSSATHSVGPHEVNQQQSVQNDLSGFGAYAAAGMPKASRSSVRNLLAFCDVGGV